MTRELRRVAVLGGMRIPFCRSNTFYADLSNLDMATAALNGLVDRFGLKGEHIDEVVGGAVVTHSKDFNLAREAVLSSQLAPSTPGVTLIQACGTSLQAALMSAGKIASGEIESAISLGSDTTSDAPIVFTKKFSKRLVELGQQKGALDKLKVFKGLSPAELAPQPPSVAEPRTGLTMGQHCELMAQEWKIPRAEQDKFAYESHKKAAAAYDSGYMDDLIVPCAGVFRDNNLRADITLEKLREIVAVARIKPAAVQVESHPYLPEWELLDFCRQRGIVLLAFAALGHGMEPNLLDDPVITAIARRVGKTPAQVALAWAVQRGTAFLTTSTKPDRIRQSVDISALPEDAMSQIRDHITTNVRFNSVVQTGVPGFIPRAR